MGIKHRFSRRQFLRIIAVSGTAGVALKLGLEFASGADAVSATRLLMGTVVNLTIVGASRSEASQAMAASLDRMALLEGVLSRFKLDSQLSRLNRNGELTGADASLLDLLVLSNRLYKQSGGAFDISVKPLLDLYTQAREHGAGIPTEASIHAALELVDAQQISVEADRIQFGKPGMAISLDGIAKGYIVDQGIAELERLGFGNIMVEAGGDLSAAGERAPGQAWRVGLQAPRDELAHLMVRFEVHDGAVATSGDYMQAFTEDLQHHHILDPRTGRSSSWLASVTVASPTTVLADALATTLMVLEPERGLALLESFPGCEAYLVTKDLEVIKSSGFEV